VTWVRHLATASDQIQHLVHAAGDFGQVGPVATFHFGRRPAGEVDPGQFGAYRGPVDAVFAEGDIEPRGFTLADRLVWNKLMNLRALGTYNWEKLSWMSQLFIASAELRESDFLTDVLHEKNERATTGALNGEAARINYRVYVDEPGAYSAANLSRRATLPETADFRRIAASDPRFLPISGRREQRKQFSRGVESTLIFYPGRGWNLRFAGAWKSVKKDESMPRFKELLAAAIARGDENPAYISGARDIVALHGADGREIAARYAAPLSFNFAVNYRFDRDSRWKNFSAGVNGNYISGYILNYIDGRGLRGGKALRAARNGLVSHGDLAAARRISPQSSQSDRNRIRDRRRRETA